MKRQQDFAALIDDKLKSMKQKLNQKIQEVKKFDYSETKNSPASLNSKNKKSENFEWLFWFRETYYLGWD